MNIIREQDLAVTLLTSAEEKTSAYQLRHQIFAEELGWVPTNFDRLETDIYDDNSVMLGIYLYGNLVACLRIIMPNQCFMIENEFSGLLSGYTVQKDNKTIEVTRFCIAPDVRSLKVMTDYGTFPFIMMLEKVFYTWCKNNQIDDVYMVVSNHFFRLLNLLGMPCKAIAPEVKMPDGVTAIAAKSSWTAFEVTNLKKKPYLLDWFLDSATMTASKLAA